MCQLCDEYEHELRRHGLIAEAEKVRAERHGEKRSEPAHSESKAERSTEASPKTAG
jgi:hypothetical protein